jgi:hypothetical protein
MEVSGQSFHWPQQASHPATVTAASFCAASGYGHPNCFQLYISVQHALICLFENKWFLMTDTEEGTSRTCIRQPEDCRIFTVRIKRRCKDDFEPRARMYCPNEVALSEGAFPREHVVGCYLGVAGFKTASGQVLHERPPVTPRPCWFPMFEISSPVVRYSLQVGHWQAEGKCQLADGTI